VTSDDGPRRHRRRDVQALRRRRRVALFDLNLDGAKSSATAIRA
jgi:hypothetical protein